MQCVHWNVLLDTWSCVYICTYTQLLLLVTYIDVRSIDVVWAIAVSFIQHNSGVVIWYSETNGRSQRGEGGYNCIIHTQTFSFTHYNRSVLTRWRTLQPNVRPSDKGDSNHNSKYRLQYGYKYSIYCRGLCYLQLCSSQWWYYFMQMHIGRWCFHFYLTVTHYDAVVFTCTCLTWKDVNVSVLDCVGLVHRSTDIFWSVSDVLHMQKRVWDEANSSMLVSQWDAHRRRGLHVW